jgi:hypothetical protein
MADQRPLPDRRKPIRSSLSVSSRPPQEIPVGQGRVRLTRMFRRGLLDTLTPDAGLI